MKKLFILYADYNISRTKTQRALCGRYNLSLFDFSDELRKQLLDEEDLTIELKRYIEEGSDIPVNVLQKLVVKNLYKIEGQRVLLSGYPKNSAQFLSFVSLLHNLNFSIESIWYLKQRDPEKFLSDYYKDPRNKGWLDKYGSEVLDRWKEKYTGMRDRISEIMSRSETMNWITAEVDYEPDVRESHIVEALKKTGNII